MGFPPEPKQKGGFLAAAAEEKKDADMETGGRARAFLSAWRFPVGDGVFLSGLARWLVLALCMPKSELYRAAARGEMISALAAYAKQAAGKQRGAGVSAEALARELHNQLWSTLRTVLWAAGVTAHMSAKKGEACPFGPACLFNLIWSALRHFVPPSTGRAVMVQFEYRQGDGGKGGTLNTLRRTPHLAACGCRYAHTRGNAPPQQPREDRSADPPPKIPEGFPEKPDPEHYEEDEYPGALAAWKRANPAAAAAWTAYGEERAIWAARQEKNREEWEAYDRALEEHREAAKIARYEEELAELMVDEFLKSAWVKINGGQAYDADPPGVTDWTFQEVGERLLAAYGGDKKVKAAQALMSGMVLANLYVDTGDKCIYTWKAAAELDARGKLYAEAELRDKGAAVQARNGGVMREPSYKELFDLDAMLGIKREYMPLNLTEWMARAAAGSKTGQKALLRELTLPKIYKEGEKNLAPRYGRQNVPRYVTEEFLNSGQHFSFEAYARLAAGAGGAKKANQYVVDRLKDLLQAYAPNYSEDLLRHAIRAYQGPNGEFDLLAMFDEGKVYADITQSRIMLRGGQR